MARFRSFLVHFAYAADADAQRGRDEKRKPTNFVVDTTRPVVYIEFSHIAERKSIGLDEPPTGLHLRLVNNSRVPIRIAKRGSRDEIVHNVVSNESRTAAGAIPMEGAIPLELKEEMPAGYSSDAIDYVNIASGVGLTFSVPINHVTPDWHIEVPFEFVLPKTELCCQPRQYAVFFESSAPVEVRPKLRRRVVLDAR